MEINVEENIIQALSSKFQPSGQEDMPLKRIREPKERQREVGGLPVGTVIRRLMNKKRIKEAELARMVKLPQTTVNRILIHPESDPRINTIVPIARSFGVTLGQLVGLEPIPDSYFSSISSDSQTPTTRMIPLLAWDDIGAWLAETQVPVTLSQMTKHWVSTERSVTDKVFAFEAMPFMQPRFSPKTLLIVDPGAAFYDGAYVLVVLHGQKATVRQVVQDGDDCYLKAIDPTMPLIKYQPEQHRVFGVIIEERRRL
jgi:SOS-response transcriptional repressor LexA/plasmid maintenance system antidote protein VapI